MIWVKIYKTLKKKNYCDDINKLEEDSLTQSDIKSINASSDEDDAFNTAKIIMTQQIICILQ